MKGVSEEDIFGFQVPVDNPYWVEVLKSVDNLSRIEFDQFLGEFAEFADEAGESPAGDVLE